MSTIVSSSQNGKNMLLKGAPDRILDKCSSYMSLAGTNKMSDQDRRAFSK
jgi:magnesium-transporting ATPase (P-type)